MKLPIKRFLIPFLMVTPAFGEAPPTPVTSVERSTYVCELHKAAHCDLDEVDHEAHKIRYVFREEKGANPSSLTYTLVVESPEDEHGDEGHGHGKTETVLLDGLECLPMKTDPRVRFCRNHPAELLFVKLVPGPGEKGFASEGFEMEIIADRLRKLDHNKLLDLGFYASDYSKPGILSARTDRSLNCFIENK